MRLATLSAILAALPLSTPARALPVPAQDHVIVVVMENQRYSSVFNQPYATLLRAQGATMASSYGVVHPSQPNYFALWAGATLVTNNNCPPAGSPYSIGNLGSVCEAAGKTWRAYSENLAVAGSSACSYDGNASSGLYTRKHAPWTSFSNLNHANERPYTDLAVDIANHTLPNLAFVVPNNCHNSHNTSTPGCGIPDADLWLSQNLPQMIGAVGPNGLVILTWDEDDNTEGNRVLTVFLGNHVIPGAITTRTVTHFTVLRTICDAFGFAPIGAAFAELPITDIWQTPTAARRLSWGQAKIRYR